MIRNDSRLTLAELRPIMEFYHAHFPSWRIVKENTLVREVPPIVQGITIDRLSGGDYRPVGHIRVLVAPVPFWGFELSQHLNVKLREIDRRRHPIVKEQVVAAMRAEFLPKLDEPLVAEEVLNLYEDQALPTHGEAYSLAALNAYLGHDARARYWSAKCKELMAKPGRIPHELDAERLAYLDQLDVWLEHGEARPQLERVLQDERGKWGLAVL